MRWKCRPLSAANVELDKGKIATKAADTAIASENPPSQQVRRPQTVKEQGDKHLKAGRYADAERFYRQVTESDAQYPAALVNLGFVLREQGRIGEARDDWNAPYTLHPRTLTVTTY